jgi:hypothetical protein
MINNTQDRAVQIRAPGSTARVGFRTPLAFLPLSGGGGGGVRNRGRTSPTAQISAPGSTAMKTIPDPPPPAFLPLSRGGGSGIPYAAFRRPRSRRPDQRRLNNPALLSCSMFSQRGPLSCLVIFQSTFLPLPCVTRPPHPFGPRGSLFFSPSTRYLPHVPFLSFPRQPLTRRRVRFSRLLPFYPMSSTMNRPPSSFSHSVTPSTPL